ncbi:ClpXP protease specificity-enhancing factor [Rheinheimera sp.]|uniref:ClpXP protease specificity-enhancing factor n=1 Tax=Rheinheimera sp. TaxID=1869214 RepID=UPI0027BAB2D1|nr:ClpXP protease specificity-enhancing factor [Rheinheimera sp.]
MTPNRPYLLRAFYEWIVDNNLTPYLVVDATLPGVKVPLQHVQNGQIVLNINPSAVGNLLLGNDAVTFNARFGGSPFALYIPQRAVLAIYARENGAGTMFTAEEDDDELLAEELLDDEAEPVVAQTETPEPTEPDDKPKRPSHLRVIK